MHKFRVWHNFIWHNFLHLTCHKDSILTLPSPLHSLKGGCTRCSCSIKEEKEHHMSLWAGSVYSAHWCFVVSCSPFRRLTHPTGPHDEFPPLHYFLRIPAEKIALLLVALSEKTLSNWEPVACKMQNVNIQCDQLKQCKWPCFFVASCGPDSNFPGILIFSE